MANWIKAIYFVVILAWVKLMYFTTYIFDLAYERGEQKCAPFFLEINQRPQGVDHRCRQAPQE